MKRLQILVGCAALSALGCETTGGLDATGSSAGGPAGGGRLSSGTEVPQGTDGDAPSRPLPDELSPQALRREGHRVLDDWHAAAAVGDKRRYLGHLAPDAVFMGTDSSERWDLATFTAYVERYFEPGSGWTYVPSERVLTLDEDRSTAWFDERLSNAGYGELRGTGVLRRTSSTGAVDVPGDTWKIVHYSMTFTVPNGVAREVVEAIRAFEEGSEDDAGGDDG